MPVVAVAGGTGNFGRAVVEAIKADGKWEVVILGRNANPEKGKELGVRIIEVDYMNLAALTTVLEENAIHTVISTLDSVAESEINLIKAADKSAATKRFIPSVWGIKFTEREAAVSPLAKVKVASAEALEGTSLEHTTFFNGFFTDYFVMPHVKSYMTPLAIVVDMANNAAAIPGSGDVPIVLTYTFDVARFVAAALTLSKWEKETYVVGDKVTWNEFVKIAEEIKGVKFTVNYDSVDLLKTGKITELPSHPHVYPFFPKEQMQGFLSFFGMAFETGLCDFKQAHTLNEDFPNIKPRKVRDLLEEAWKGK